MKALYWDGLGALEWRDDPEPAILAPTDALVRPIAVAPCDLDEVIVHAETPVPGSEQPFAIGHEGVGEVLEVGAAVTTVRPGDVVAVSYHLSCGTCDRCRADLPLFCRATYDGAIAMYGMPIGQEYGGLFSELIRVPFAEHTLVQLPPTVSAVQAVSAGDNLVDAWRAIVPPLVQRPGADVLIFGFGSIGLYAVDIAQAYGAGHIWYIDVDPKRQAIAAGLGANACAPGEFDPQQHLYPITVNASDDDSGEALRTCLLATEPGGLCTNATIHFLDCQLPMFHMFLNCLTLTGGLSHARTNMPAALTLLSSDRIHPTTVLTDVLPFYTADAMAGAGFKPVFVRDPVLAPPERLQSHTITA